MVDLRDIIGATVFAAATNTIAFISLFVVNIVRDTLSAVHEIMYSDLIVPVPPPVVFMIVWPVLYTLIGIASWVVFRDGAQTEPLLFLVANLIANFLWPVMFFGYTNALAAFIVIIVLDVSAAGMWGAYRQQSKLAGWLLVPYLLWVTYATIINALIIF